MKVISDCGQNAGGRLGVEALPGPDGQSAHYARSLIEASPDPLVTINRDGKITDVNRATEEVTGLPRTQLVGTEFCGYFTEPERAHAVYREAFAGRPVAGYPLAIRHVSGKLTEVLYNASPYRDEQGAVAGVFAAARNVTEWKLAEGALRASEQRYRRFVEHNAAGMLRSTPDGRLLEANAAFVHMLGYGSREELLSHRAQDLYFEKADREPLLQRLRLRGALSDYELCFRRKDGAPVWVLLNIRVEEQAETVFESTVMDITQRKRDQEIIRRQAGRYAAILATSISGFWVADLNGRLQEVNDAYCRMSGYSREELLSMNISDLEAVESPEQVAEHIQKLAAGGSDHFESRHRRKDGAVIEVEISACHMPETAQMLLFARDVTGLKNAVQQSREASLYARSLIEASLDPLVTISREGRITDVNQATEKATGLPRERLIGSDFSDYFTEPEKARQGYRQVFEKGFVQDYPLALRRTSGQVMEVLYNASLYRNEDGSAAGVFAAARDVTARKLAEEATRASEGRYRSLVENLPQMIFVKDRDSTYVSCNLAFARILGIEPHEFSGKCDYDFFDRELADKYRADDRRVMESGRTTEIEEEYIRGGQRMFVQTVKTPLRDGSGRVTGLLGIFWDITERKLAEAELARYRQHLEELVSQRTAELEKTNQSLAAVNSELETFAYSVSHDLRTPLRAVDGFSRLLLEEYAGRLDAEGQRIVHVVRDSTRKMAQMIDDILSFSRVGRQELALSPVDMQQLARAALQELAPALAGRDLRVEFQPLPAAHGDPQMIQRLWSNLLDNAIKFTRERAGGVIEVGARSSGDETVYYVRDNGVGFDMQYGGKLFGVFQRLHAQEEFPGTGIGLAIVKRIVTRHGGRAWAEGQVNQGATFYFTLQEGAKS